MPSVAKDEPREEYESLLNGLRDHLQPVGTLEILLVERLATQFWRQRRLLIAEGTEIQKGREFAAWDEEQDHEALAEEILDRSISHGLGLMSEIVNPILLQWCLDQLEDLRANIKLSGFELERDEEILTKVYGPYFKAREKVCLSPI
jgi:hypothetical protein